MQLGAYMARSGWQETARVYLQKAGELATNDRDFEIQYSIGEYFHNIEEDVSAGADYFRSSAEKALNIMSTKSSEAASNAKKRLFDVLKLVPESAKSQGEVILMMKEKVRTRES